MPLDSLPQPRQPPPFITLSSAAVGFAALVAVELLFFAAGNPEWLVLGQTGTACSCESLSVPVNPLPRCRPRDGHRDSLLPPLTMKISRAASSLFWCATAARAAFDTGRVGQLFRHGEKRSNPLFDSLQFDRPVFSRSASGSKFANSNTTREYRLTNGQELPPPLSPPPCPPSLLRLILTTPRICRRWQLTPPGQL